MFATSALASSAFVGTWFSCEVQSGEYQILTVEKPNNQYTGFLESSNNGGVYTALLSGGSRKSSLTLSGCQNYRGEICPEPKAHISIILKNNSRSSGFTHIPKQSLDQRIKQCSKNSQSDVFQ
jgi:hypothetical protein